MIDSTAKALNARITEAVLARTGKSRESIAAGPLVVKHPSGEARWAIRVEWKDDAVAEFLLEGEPAQQETSEALGVRLEPVAWRTFPKSGNWTEPSAFS